MNSMQLKFVKFIESVFDMIEKKEKGKNFIDLCEIF